MSSHLLIPNTTQVPNVILDEVMRTLSTAALKVLFAICRFTFGFGKQSDSISLRQLQEMTGLSRSGVVRCRKQLGNLIKIIPGSATEQRASVYALNLNIASGQLVTFCDQASDIASVPSEPIQTNSKPIKSIGGKPPKTPNPSFPIVEKTIRRLNELAATSFRTNAPATVRVINARLAEGFTEQDLAMVLEHQWNEWGNNKKMAVYFRPETLFATKHFEGYLQAAKLNGNGHAPVKEELEGDMVKVDGVTMDRKTYELRYGRTN